MRNVNEQLRKAPYSRVINRHLWWASIQGFILTEQELDLQQTPQLISTITPQSTSTIEIVMAEEIADFYSRLFAPMLTSLAHPPDVSRQTNIFDHPSFPTSPTGTYSQPSRTELLASPSHPSPSPEISSKAPRTGLRTVPTSPDMNYKEFIPEPTPFVKNEHKHTSAELTLAGQASTEQTLLTTISPATNIYSFLLLTILLAAILRRIDTYRREVWELEHEQPIIPLFAIFPEKEDESMIDADEAEACAVRQAERRRFRWPNWWDLMPVMGLEEWYQRALREPHEENRPSMKYSTIILLWWLIVFPANVLLWTTRLLISRLTTGRFAAMWDGLGTVIACVGKFLLRRVQAVVLDIEMIKTMGRERATTLFWSFRRHFGEEAWQIWADVFRLPATWKKTTAVVLAALIVKSGWVGLPSFPASDAPILMPVRDRDSLMACGWHDWLSGQQARSMTVVDGRGTTTLLDCFGVSITAPLEPFPTVTTVTTATVTVTSTVRQYCPLSQRVTVENASTTGEGGGAASWRGRSFVVADNASVKYCGVCRQKHAHEHALR